MNIRYFFKKALDTPTEKRAAGRVRTNLKLGYRIGLQWQEARIMNLSETGLRFETSKNGLLPKSEVELHLMLPESHESLKLRGTIVWVQSDSEKTECGVLFCGKRRHSVKTRMIQFLADKIARLIVREDSNPFSCRLRKDFGDLERVYRLLYDEYVRRGYCKEDTSGLYYTYFSLLPESQIFLLEEGNILSGTISLIPDSPCGLPMEAVFPLEIAHVRSEGRRIGEVSLLALKSDIFRTEHFSLTSFKKFKASFLLFKTLFDYALRKAHVTDLLIAVHPKHELLYRYLAFEPLGPIKTYPGACEKPALPMRLEIKEAVRKASKYRGIGFYFLNHPTPDETLQTKYVLNTEEITELLFKIRPLWKTIPLEHLAYLKACYPGLSRFRRDLIWGSSEKV